MVVCKVGDDMNIEELQKKDVLKEFHTSLNGKTSEEVILLQKKYGLNELPNSYSIQSGRKLGLMNK